MKTKPSILLMRADKYRQKINAALEPIDRALSELLDEIEASVQWQGNDGWVILFDAEMNATITFDEIDHLLSLSREDALIFLRKRII